jgi:hypothetical protein
MRDKRMFAAFSKLKKDVKDKEPPKVSRANLKYFAHDIHGDFILDNVINIDLNSAYPTIMLNSGYITQDTFSYLQKIPKTDRLASIGMLASKKYEFTYNKDSTLVSFDKITSPYEDFFFFCVKITQEIMTDLRLICNLDYLFTWVDGIYFRCNDELLPVISEYLESKYFKWSVDILSNFECRIVRGKIKVSFVKDEKKKYFNIPARDSMLATDIVNYLTNQSINNENDFNTKITRRAGN